MAEEAWQGASRARDGAGAVCFCGWQYFRVEPLLRLLWGLLLWPRFRLLRVRRKGSRLGYLSLCGWGRFGLAAGCSGS